MGRKKKAKTPQPYADIGNTNFAMVRDGLLQSAAFQALTVGERYFYIVCLVQARTQKCGKCLYNHAREDGKEEPYSEWSFVFPAAHMRAYGYDSGNGSRYLQMLTEKGFIERVENNKHRQRVNVYRFTTKWKEEKPP
ncbi:MAG: hypothetical protein IKQ49_06270 [Eubacterium sp.]|nr:hypothetical protein [Eubacterium sp.]